LFAGFFEKVRASLPRLLRVGWLGVVELFQGGLEGGDPEFVTLAVHMQAVFEEELRTGIAFFIKHDWEDVDVVQEIGVADVGFDEAIGFDDFIFVLPAGDAWFDGDKKNVGLRKGPVSFLHEGFEIVENILGGFGREIVVTGVEDDRFGRVRFNDAVEVVINVGNLRAAEAAIDHGILREIRGDGFPDAEAGAANEEKRIGGRCVRFIAEFKVADLRLPLLDFLGRSFGMEKAWDESEQHEEEIAQRHGEVGRTIAAWHSRKNLFLSPFARKVAGMDLLTKAEIQRAVKLALAEDVGSGDATTLATIPPNALSEARMVAREELVVSGMDVAVETFQQVFAGLQIKRLSADGLKVEKGTVLMEISGPAQAILTAERVALNFVQRMSGVATITAKFVEAVQGTKAQILDTRKTTPGLRLFEKYAVKCGGGKNHRIGLFDMVLVKDNHLAALSLEPPNPVAAAVLRAREKYPQLKVEIEADTAQQVQQAVEAGADFILLDNMTLDEMRTAVFWVNGRAKLEASGGVNLQTVHGIAETGVDFISVGALTHSARAVDIALDF
jgi:nicotinate-nucleotide pyrophosphorylase (carboxylating)